MFENPACKLNFLLSVLYVSCSGSPNLIPCFILLVSTATDRRRTLGVDTWTGSKSDVFLPHATYNFKPKYLFSELHEFRLSRGAQELDARRVPTIWTRDLCCRPFAERYKPYQCHNLNLGGYIICIDYVLPAFAVSWVSLSVLNHTQR